MPPYKNQHYVPESYLKAWATDTSVSIYHLEQEREFPSQNISDICSRSYFNSEEVYIEPVLGKLEGAHAKAFNALRDGTLLRSLSIGERRLLLSFVFTQRQRTRLMRDEIRDSAEEYFRENIRKDVAAAGYDPTEYTDLEDVSFEQTVQNVHHFMMLHGILAPIGNHDLACAVLENETGIDFITSEAPVIFANPRFKEERDMTYVGMANGGLQVYCPLSPRLCLLFYDPEVYLVKTDRSWHASLTEPADVRELNLLQMLTTDTFVLYETPGQETAMQQLAKEAQKFESKESIPQPIPGTDQTDADYSYEPPHQLHDLTPTPEPISFLANVEFKQRQRAPSAQRQIIRCLLERTDTTEETLLQAVSYILSETDEKISFN